MTQHPTPIPPPAVPGLVGYDELQAVPDGLTAEQEIRADALAAAARLFPPTGTNAFFWAAVARFENYIRDGNRPGSTMVCLCTEQERTEQRWRSDCPAHGARTEAS